MKNFILKTLTGVAVTGAIVSSCMMDSISYVPFFVYVGCYTWIGLFCYANRERFGGEL